MSLWSLQACRGARLDPGVEVDSAVESSDSSYRHHLSIPVDTAVMYATPPGKRLHLSQHFLLPALVHRVTSCSPSAGYAAFMHPLGSVFLQTFCSLLTEEDNRDLELTRLLTRLAHRVAFTFQAKGRQLAGKKEMPCLLTRLTRDVFPFSEPAKESGLSATALVQTRTRTRTPSIS